MRHEIHQFDRYGRASVVKSIYHTSAKSYIRQRAQCLLLSHQGYPVSMLADIFTTRTHTVRGWFNRWESEGISGLSIRPGRGLKPVIRLENIPLVESIKKEVGEHPQNIKEVVTKLNPQWNLDLSEGQLKTFLKKS